MRVWVALLALLLGFSARADQCSAIWPAAVTGTSTNAPDIPGGLSYSGTLNADATLPAGEHDYNSMTYSGTNTLAFTGSGTTVLYLQSLTVSGNAVINSANNVDLIIIVNGAASISGDAVINGLIYSGGTISIANSPAITGAVTAAGAISGGSSVVYDSNAVSAAESSDNCEGPPSYPYSTGFEGSNSEWTVNGDFSVSSDGSGPRQPRTGSKVLDNNEADIDQSRHYSDHTAELNQSIAIPVSATDPELSFYYKLDAIDSNDHFRVYIYSETDDDWTQVESFNNEQDNTDYRRYAVDLSDYIGDSIRVRFEQYITSYNTGARLFLVDDLAIQDKPVTAFSFPYSTSFESEDADEWYVHADFEMSQADHNGWVARTGSGFLDNNGNETPEEDQRRHYDNHWAELAGQVAIPADATAPELSFYYKLDAIDSNDKFRVYIYSAAADSWSLNTTFDNEQDNSGYRQYSINLDAYKGDSISVRFEQYITSYTNGPRLFVVDDLAIQERPVVEFSYPYTNGFEAGETDDWQFQSDIEISQTNHNGWIANTGSGFLDNNPNEEDQRRHYDNHWAQMSGFVPVPNDAVIPTLSFSYKIDAIDSNDKFYIEVQASDESSWTTLITLSENDDKAKYARYDYHLDDSYKGKSIRIRLRQYITSYTSGTRVFVMDDVRIGDKLVDASLPYPYENTFDTEDERADWNARSDVDISVGEHDTDYVPFSPDGFIDTNPDYEDQRRHYSNHLIEMTKYVPVPNEDNVVLTFKYKLNALDSNDKYYIEIQSADSANWAVIESLSTQHNHNTYTNYEASLAAYKGKSVRLRIRQYITSYNSGQRLFVIDNWRIGPQTDVYYDFPYFNDFETETSTVVVNGDDSDDTNGRDQWNHEGDWDISGVNDLSVTPERTAYDGSYYLNNNGEFNEDQRRHYVNHEMSMLGYVLIPADATRPEASFFYKLDVLDSNDKFYFEYQTQGNSLWTTIQTFSVDKIHHTHTQFRYALPDSLKGQNVRFRFRQYITSYTNGPRHFTVDNFRLAERELIELDYPYFNDLEAAESTVVVDGDGTNDVNGIDHWNHEGDWGVSTTAHGNWNAYRGSGYIDNNPNEEDQRRHYSGHTIDMQGAMTIPAGATEPELSFFYKLDVIDSNDKFYVEIQQADDLNWTTLQTLSINDEHDEYTRVSIDLSSYKGARVRVRFRQYITSYNNGTRLFTVDDFRIGDKIINTYAFPYFNGFEDAESDQDSGINGRDQWNHQGDWYFSDTTHGDDGQASPKSGSWYLDSNRDDEDQRRKYSNQITEMNGYVAIPADATSPVVKFDYKLDFIDSSNDRIYLEIQEQGSTSWSTLKQFRLADEQLSYTAFTTSLDAYKGKSIRIRFRTYITSYTNGARYMAIDNFKIGQQFAGWWQMEDNTLDASGSNFDASAGGVGNIGFSSIGPANIIGNDSTCKYVELSGQNYLTVPSSANASLLDEYTVSTWVYPDADPDTGEHYTGFKAIATKGNNFQLKLNNGKVYWWWGGGDRELQSDTTLTVNDWTHVAITYKNGEQRIYLNGVLDASHNSTTSLNTSSNIVLFGADADEGGSIITSRNLDGRLDEIRIYETAQSAAEIQADMAIVRPCAPAIDHILITHSGSGVACVEHSVNIKLCADESCETNYIGDNVFVTLQKDVDGDVSDIGLFEIDGETGSAQVSFTDTNIGNWNFRATSTEVEDFECKDDSTGSNSCTYESTQGGFIVLDNMSRVANSCSANSFVIQAVTTVEGEGSEACKPAFESGTHELRFTMNYNSPNADWIGANLADGAAFSNVEIEGEAHSANEQGPAINFTFNEDAETTIAPIYSQAGEINLTIHDASGTLADVTTNLKFVPPSLTLEWAEEEEQHIAGVAQNIKVKGQCDSLLLGNYTPSGQFEVHVTRSSPTDDVILAANPDVTPADLESFTVNITAIDNEEIDIGVAETVDISDDADEDKTTVGVKYDEKATLEIELKDTDYLEQVEFKPVGTITADFEISHYAASTNTPKLTHSCAPFSYIGEPIDWLASTHPEITVIAKSAEDDVIEFSDIEDIWALSTANISTEMLANTYTEADVSKNNSTVLADNPVPFAVTETNESAVDGSRTYGFNTQRPIYTKMVTPDIPFNVELTLTVPKDAFVDSDGKGIKTSHSDTTFNDVVFSGITGTELRYGRLKVTNSAGSELESLYWSPTIEYFNTDSQWQRNADDSGDGCSFITENAVTIDGLNNFDVENESTKYNVRNSQGDPVDTTFLNGMEEESSVTASSGLFEFEFAAPANGGVGSFDIQVNLEDELQWLKWDWDNDGSLDTGVPDTSVMFGRYRGNDRIIFKRER